MTAGSTENDCVTEAALYVVLLFADCPPGADAVILHTPTPVMVTVAVPVVAPTEHGPDAGAEKLTGSPDNDDALTEGDPLPYTTFAKGPKLMVCDWMLEPLGRIENVPETESAAI
jgi:hypothetical protein